MNTTHTGMRPFSAQPLSDVRHENDGNEQLKLLKILLPFELGETKFLVRAITVI